MVNHFTVRANKSDLFIKTPNYLFKNNSCVPEILKNYTEDGQACSRNHRAA